MGVGVRGTLIYIYTSNVFTYLSTFIHLGPYINGHTLTQPAHPSNRLQVTTSISMYITNLLEFKFAHIARYAVIGWTGNNIGEEGEGFQNPTLKM